MSKDHNPIALLDGYSGSPNPLTFVWFSSRPYWPYALLVIAGVTVTSLMGVGVAYLFKLVVDAAAKLPSETAYRQLEIAIFVYMGVRFLSECLTRLNGFMMAKWSVGSMASSSDLMTQYLIKHSRSYFADRFAGSLLTKIQHGVTGVREVIHAFVWQCIPLVITAIGSFFLAAQISGILAGLFFGWVVTTVIFNWFFSKKRTALARLRQKAHSKLNGMTTDILSNIVAVQDYARSPFETKRTRETLLERYLIGIRGWHNMETTLLYNTVIQAVFAVALMVFMLRFAQAGLVSAGDIVLIFTLILNIQNQMQWIGSYMSTLNETWGDMAESLEDIFKPHEIVDRVEAKELVVSRGEIVFNAVAFGYADRPLFENFSLNIAAGQRVGLVGQSGAGKSSLFKMLLRGYDAQAGSIMIDGQDIKQVTQESLHCLVGVVPQEPFLFHRTIKENIAYGKEGASDDEIEAAAQLAQAHEFITRLSEGYESVVGERGVKLSGGERQRVVVARAILKNAPILLLDEATSALDSESEAAIQNALRTLMKEKTVLAIAHRLSTLREMDRIIVMEAGRIVEDGTHETLLAQGGIYARLWAHQAGGFLVE